MPGSSFKLLEPVFRESSVVFASPHSGSEYPQDFLSRSKLDRRAIRSSEDAFVDRLFQGVTDLGAPLIAAVAPRAFVDLNRSPDELDPALIEGVPKSAHNPRVSSGLGVVPRVVANGRSIHAGKIPLTEAQARIDGHWRPYHAALAKLIDESRVQFGQAILIDCHSMPHEAIESIGSSRGGRPEIVLGDRFGAAAASDVVDRIEAAMVGAGLRVARNAPFAGAYVTQSHGRPARNRHVVQVEIDRALYMNEQQIRPNNNFRTFKALIDRVVADITEIGRADLQMAAE